MPNRQSNKLRALQRQRRALERASASVLQEAFRNHARDFDRTRQHILKWQLCTSQRAPPAAAQNREGQESREGRVRFGEDIHFDHPKLAERRTAQIEALDHELQCRVCQEPATAPMFLNCCHTAAEFGCICFACMYRYLQLDVMPDARHQLTAPWSPSCANTSLCQRVRRNSLSFSSHISNACADRLSDATGDSKCFACATTCETTVALRRHFAVCGELHEQCTKCSFYGLRREMPVHMREVHEYVPCPCCDKTIAVVHWASHAAQHVRELSLTRVTLSGRFVVRPDGSVNTSSVS